MASFMDLVPMQATAAVIEDDDMMSYTAISSLSPPTHNSCEELRDSSGDLPMSQDSCITSVFADLPHEDALIKAGRFLEMSWHVLVQLVTFKSIKARFILSKGKLIKRPLA